MAPTPRVIVLVDDVEQVTTIAADYLQRRLPGVRVLATTRPQEALAWLRDEPVIDLVLSDNHMGEMDGLTLLGHARRMRPDTTRALMTAYLDLAGTPRELGAIGVHALIRKPWEWPEFARFVGELLGLEPGQRAQLEQEGPVGFPANAFAEFAAHRAGLPFGLDAASGGEAAGRHVEMEADAEALEARQPAPVPVARDPLTGEGRVKCPHCEQDFAIHEPAPAPAPGPAAATLPRAPSRLGPPQPPAAAPSAQAARRPPAAALTEDEEALRLLTYLRKRPGVAQRLRSLQSRGGGAGAERGPSDRRAQG